MAARRIAMTGGGVLRLALRRAALAGVLLLAASVSLSAQSTVCRQIEAELATAGRGDAPRQAPAQRRQLAQVQAAMGQMGCDRGGFLFGPQPPAQCAGLRAQAGALAGAINQIEAGGGGDGARRRAQLYAAYESNGCGRARAPAPQRAPRNVFEQLFGVPQEAEQPRYSTAPMVNPDDPTFPGDDMDGPDAERPRGGGSLAVCVRTCDGFFFPVNYQGARQQHGDVCRASCPGAPTELYWMSLGGGIENARSSGGAPYSALPAALRYRQSYDAACACKAQNQSWGVVLRQAEQLIRDSRDMVVTDAASVQMARPAPVRGLRGVAGSEDEAKPEEGAPPPRAEKPKRPPPRAARRREAEAAGPIDPAPPVGLPQ